MSEIDKKFEGRYFTWLLISLNQQSEDSFADFYLKPLIREVVLNSCDNNIVYSGSDAPDPNTASKKKPDIMLGFKNRKREVYVFFVELERPDKLSKYQVEDNHCKLMKHLKSSIDAQVKIGIENPTSIGLLYSLISRISGLVCSLTKMSIAEEGIYLPVTLRKFRLPKCSILLLSGY
ncbi:hypothetical protein EDC94DRAFT_509052 [Helicostylum pulchrum]|nr:hypothetical protein EDC94DRAFT_509052 [Helicostylum pulchrum]